MVVCKAAFTLLLCVVAFAIQAQDADALMQEAAKAEIELKEAVALDKYKEVLQIQALNSKALNRSSELCGRIGSRQTDEQKKLDYLTVAKTYAATSLQVNARDADANFVNAAVAYRFSLITNGKERMQYLRDMKQYADTALSIDPRHGKAMYLVGKWNDILTNLGALEKSSAKLLFGGLPKTSLDNAIQAYEKARSYDPFIVIDYLDLAHAYIRNHQSDKAIEVLNKMIKLPNRTEDDPGLKVEGRKLVATLQ